MTKDEFKLIVKGMKAIYADPKFIADKTAFDMWYALLQDIPYDICTMATQAYMQSERFVPTPADIRKYANQITSPLTNDMSEIEAWGMVRKAISNGYYHSEQEFKKLPKLIQETLGSHERLREMSQLDLSDVETVEQSHFVRNYRAKLEQHKNKMQLGGELRISIDQMRSENTPLLDNISDIPQIEVKEEPKEFPAEIEEELKAFYDKISV